MEQETLVRLGVFVAVFAIMAVFESLLPRRVRVLRRSIRWFGNLSLATLNAVLVPLVMPLVAMGMASLAQERGWGLLNLVEVPYWVAFVGSVVALDFVIYLQHVMFHAVPVLWRLHRVHHSDVELDVSSGIRFHIIEIFISMGIKIAAIMVMGPPVLAVLTFEVVLNATALFNHANVRIPLGLDRVLRLFLVTPDMHRVHHSIVRLETDSNFGFNLPWWDYLCGTYRGQPAAGHEGMTIGVPEYREERDSYPHQLLAQPFRKSQHTVTAAAEEESAS